jgi:hypothetical protein
MNTSKNGRSTRVPSSSVTQLLVTAAASRPYARMRRIASSIAGRGCVDSATRPIMVRAEMRQPCASQSVSKAG